MNFSIRNANAGDVSAIMSLIHELAAFERQPEEVKNTEAQILEDGFGKIPAFFALLAEVDGKVRGMAIAYYSYSTWKGRSIYIDDIIVSEAYRGKGLGRALMEATIARAKSEGVGKLHWQVLDWNEPAIGFYKKYNPSFDAEWINCALSKEKLQDL